MTDHDDDYAPDESTFEQHGDDPQPDRGPVPPAARQALPLPLDLHDAEVANEVADAIRRFHPDRFVPLSERYPWLHRRDEDGPYRASLVDAITEALRASADVHEAEQQPNLVTPLRVLATSLETGALVTMADPIPPGRCGAIPPPWIDERGNRHEQPWSCDSRHGHTGQHESTYYPPVPGLTAGVPVAWDDVTEPDEVEVHGFTFTYDQLPDALGTALAVQDGLAEERRRLTARLERLSALIAEGEEASGHVGLYAGRLRAALLADDPPAL